MSIEYYNMLIPEFTTSIHEHTLQFIPNNSRLHFACAHVAIANQFMGISLILYWSPFTRTHKQMKIHNKIYITIVTSHTCKYHAGTNNAFACIPLIRSDLYLCSSCKYILVVVSMCVLSIARRHSFSRRRKKQINNK